MKMKKKKKNCTDLKYISTENIFHIPSRGKKKKKGLLA